MSAVGGGGLLAPAGAEVFDGLALPRVALTAVLRELDGEPASRERSKRTAGVDGRQLPVVADEDELAAGSFDMVEDRRELPRAGHASLVDHQDDAPRKPLAALESGNERGEARRRDAGLVLELLRGMAGDGGPEDG